MSLYKCFYCSTCFECYYVMRVTHKTAVLYPALEYHPTPAEPYQYTSTHRNRAVHPHTVASSWGWM